MQLDHSFRTISSRVFRIMGKEKKETRRLEISAPFNFQHVNASLGGISPDEVSVMREQAAATRIGIADPDPTESYTHYDDDDDELFYSDASSSYSPRYYRSPPAARARTSMLPELGDYSHYYNSRPGRATSAMFPRRQYASGLRSFSSASSRRSVSSRQSASPGSPRSPVSPSASASPPRKTGVRQSVGPGPLVGMYPGVLDRV